MIKFAFMVVLFLTLGGLIYFQFPAGRASADKVMAAATADAQKLLDHPAKKSNAAPVQIQILQDNPPPSAESTSAANMNPISTTDQDFENEVINSPVSVVVEFWKPGSKYCVQLKPELVKLAAGVADRYKVVTVNTQECPETTKRFPVTEVPTIFLFENGKITKELRERSAREIKVEVGHR